MSDRTESKRKVAASVGILLLLSLLVLPSVVALLQTTKTINLVGNIGVWTWQDDFIDQNPRWKWWYNAGSGYKICPSTFEGYSVVEGGITTASTTVTYSDCALELEPAYNIYPGSTVTFEARLKFTHSMASGGKGSQGVILWDGSAANAVGFLDISPESSSWPQGFRAYINSGGVSYQNVLLTGIDIRSWHAYRFILNATGTSLYVDGNLVAHSSARPNVQTTVNCWVDNCVYNADGSMTRFLTLPETQKMYIDYAKRSDQVLLP